MLVRRSTGAIEHLRFRDLPGLLGPRDLLVLNDTRVFPARLVGRKQTGARIEVLLVREVGVREWEALLRPGRRCPAGTRLSFADSAFELVVGEESPSALRAVRFEGTGDLWDWFDRVGQTPLPPYIHRPDSQASSSDRDRYQTVYARHRGSVAAPTAGLHFTPELLERLDWCSITLHVGYGTFQPIQTEEVEAHQMEPEWFMVGAPAAAKIQQRLADGGRVIAVGTTTTRTLEHLAAEQGEVSATSGSTRLFIYPGFEFRVVGGLVTNFHLPGSTLLLLVSAFAGKELIREAYRIAVAERYRFYSYGDAMLIL